MSKAYDKAPQDIFDRAKRMMEKYHPDLVKAEVTLDILVVSCEEGVPLALGGYPAMAVVRIISLKGRVKGMADAEITIDRVAYDHLEDERKDALIDHELYHLRVCYDDDGCMRTDDAGRPKLRMRKHDWQMGWFTEVAIRHGRFSVEAYQAKLLWEEAGRAYFPMLTEVRS